MNTRAERERERERERFFIVVLHVNAFIRIPFNGNYDTHIYDIPM